MTAPWQVQNLPLREEPVAPAPPRRRQVKTPTKDIDAAISRLIDRHGYVTAIDLATELGVKNAGSLVRRRYDNGTLKRVATGRYVRAGVEAAVETAPPAPPAPPSPVRVSGRLLEVLGEWETCTVLRDIESEVIVLVKEVKVTL